MFSVPGSEKDPVAASVQIIRKKEANRNERQRRFILSRCKQLYKKGIFQSLVQKVAVGVNKVNSLMRKMAEKAGLGPNAKNHSGRKTMIQALTNNAIPATDIIQLSGHKNLESVINYSVVSEREQVIMSLTLSELSEGNLQNVDKSNCSTSLHSASSSAADYKYGHQAMSLFTGAVIHGGQFNISVKSLKQSPTLTSPEFEIKSTKRHKRLKVLDWDSGKKKLCKLMS